MEINLENLYVVISLSFKSVVATEYIRSTEDSFMQGLPRPIKDVKYS